MIGLAAGLIRPSSDVTLQHLLLHAHPDRQDLYWRCSPDTAAEPGGILVAAGQTLSFDTYFNSFFESHWRRHTKLAELAIRVELEGEAILLVYRRALDRKTLIHRQTVHSGITEIAIPDRALNFRQYGVLSVELAAKDDDATFRGGAWVGRVPGRTPVGLAAVFCTFNRERDLAGCLDALAGDAGLLAQLARVVVVNQGSPGLAQAPALAAASARLGGKLVVLDQVNRGGAGGFTRGLLAALDDDSVTHAVLLDDDIQIEPGSLSRMIEFFAAAKQDIVIGGQMLDLLQPTYLYEAGAVITRRHWAFQPDSHGVDVGNAAALEPLSRPAAVHYNGWWCCGLPLALIRQHGLPLPCFIRGDDVELGLRLGNQGVPTVSMPGVAVWHEPFYLKLGGWQLYYETRNMLVTASLHMPFSRLGLLRRMARQVVQALLTYRYYNAALLLDGIRDFLQGPGVMQADPLPQHAALAARRADFPVLVTPREKVLEEQQPGRVPRTATVCLLLMGRLMIRNAIVPSAAGQPRSLPVSDISWIGMKGIDHAVLETWWDEARPTLRRSREHHRALLRRAVPLLLRLLREGPATAQAWREAAPALTSDPFWRGYLGLPQPCAKPALRMAAE